MVNLTDSTGAVTKIYDYDAFGNELSPDAADENPFRYCGEYWDAETTTYYLRARYYDPLTGRFLTEDHALDGLNWYTYCCSNPIFFVDPTGEVVEILYEDIDGKIYNHAAIVVNGVLYSYATYNLAAGELPIINTGSILVCDKEVYIDKQIEKGRTITAYEINLSQDEEAALLDTLNGYIAGLEDQCIQSKEYAGGVYYYGKKTDRLDTYVLLNPFVRFFWGGNCVDFVNKSLDESGMPRTLFTRQARFVPMAVYISLERDFLLYRANVALAKFWGTEYMPVSGCVINKTVYQ